MREFIGEYIEFRKKDKLSELSYYIYQKQLEKFFKYLESSSLTIANLRRTHIEEYIAILQEEKSSTSFINQMISSLKGFFEYLKENKKINNPMVEISHYKFENVSKKLGSSDVSEIIHSLLNEELIEVRDRLILLLIIQYSFNGTALCNLKCTDIKQENNLVEIKNGKESVKINDPKFLSLYNQYIDDRKKIETSNDELFITKSGKPIQKPHITYIVKRLSQLLNIESDSLVLFSKANKIKTNKESLEMINGRYAIIKEMPENKNYQLLKVVDRKDGNSNKLLRIYSFRNISDKLIDSVKKAFSSLRLLESSNIIKVFDLQIDESNESELKLYLTTEYFHGKNLRAYAGELDFATFLEIARALLIGLSVIHKKSMIHGDINPRTIFVAEIGSKLTPKYCEIGLLDSSNNPILILKGGNPFVAPEFFSNSALDFRSDIYSLGVIFFYLITREYPDATNKNKTDKIIDKLINMNIPERACRTIQKMIKINPQERFNSVDDCIEQFNKLDISKEKKSSVILSNFTIKLTEEVSLIEGAITALKENKDSPKIILIKGKNNSGKSYLIDEARSISIINSLPFYFLSLQNNSEAKILVDLFSGETKQSVSETNYFSDQSETPKMSLLEKTSNNINNKLPLIFAIDNFEESSDEFFDFFVHILKRQLVRNGRVVFVLSINSESKKLGNIENKIIDLVNNNNLFLSIDLKLFPRNDIAELLRVSFKQDFSENVIDYISKTSSGRMRKISDIVNFLLESEYLEYNESIQKISFLPNFYESIEKRVDSNFSDLSNSVLRIVSAFKRPIGLNLLIDIILATTTNLVNKDIRSAIDLLIQKKVLSRKLEDNENLILFENKFTEILYYQQMTGELKSKIHDSIAYELEKRDFKNDKLEEIAEHFFLAENKQKTFQYFKIKAEKAILLGFSGDALLSYNKIFVFFDNLNSDEKIELLCLRIKVLIELLELEKANEDLELLKNLVIKNEDIIKLKILSIKATLKGGRIREGLIIINETIFLAERFSSLANHYELIILKGTSLIQLSRYKDAINFISKMVELHFTKVDSNQLYLKNQLGLSYFYTGEYEKAKIIFKEILNELNRYSFDKIKLRTLNNLGMLCFQICDFDSAMEYYNSSLLIADKINDIIAKCAILINLAGLNYRIGRFHKAELLFEKISDIYETIGDVQNYETVLLEMGLLYTNIGLYDKAEFYHKRAENLSAEHSNNIILGYSHALGGEISRCNEKFDLALYHYSKAEEIFQKYNHIRELVLMHIYKTNTLIKYGKLNESHELITKVMQIKNIDTFNDITPRIILLEIFFLLNSSPIKYSEIDEKFTQVKDNSIIKTDWELHLNYLRLFIIFLKLIGKYDEANEKVLIFKNEMRGIIDGFATNIRDSFLQNSEFGKFLRDFELHNLLERPNIKSYDEIIGVSEKIKIIIEQLKRISNTECAILIEGESGTGKELVARAIHKNSKRSDKPFIAENCAAFSANLLESELFGFKKGAFTDAHTDRKGIVELADSGTLFLDEVGDMTLDMQKKLLRFLQTGEFFRVGEENPRKSHVRIISATNRSLKNMVEEEKFRLDLYHRLNEFGLNLPPLRERREDVPLLVRHFIDKYNKLKKENIFIEDGVIELFSKYNWPGNIRELENEINRLIVLCENNKIGIELIEDDPKFVTGQFRKLYHD